MALFLSTYINKVDRKGRVSVPASYRNALAGQSFNGIVGFRSYRLPAIEGLAMDRMEQLSTSLDAFDVFSESQDDLAATIFADAHQLSFDAEGRILLPEALLAHAGIEDRAAFVGRGATFQIWEPEAMRHHHEKARGRVRDQGLTLRLGAAAPPNGEAR